MGNKQQDDSKPDQSLCSVVSHDLDTSIFSYDSIKSKSKNLEEDTNPKVTTKWHWLFIIFCYLITFQTILAISYATTSISGYLLSFSLLGSGILGTITVVAFVPLLSLYLIYKILQLKTTSRLDLALKISSIIAILGLGALTFGIGPIIGLASYFVIKLLAIFFVALIGALIPAIKKKVDEQKTKINSENKYKKPEVSVDHKEENLNTNENHIDSHSAQSLETSTIDILQKTNSQSQKITEEINTITHEKYYLIPPIDEKQSNSKTWQEFYQFAYKLQRLIQAKPYQDINSQQDLQDLIKKLKQAEISEKLNSNQVNKSINAEQQQILKNIYIITKNAMLQQNNNFGELLKKDDFTTQLNYLEQNVCIEILIQKHGHSQKTAEQLYDQLYSMHEIKDPNKPLQTIIPYITKEQFEEELKKEAILQSISTKTSEVANAEKKETDTQTKTSHNFEHLTTDLN